MRFAVAIPYRPNGQPERQRNFEYVYDWFASHSYPVLDIDTPHERFNRSAARNAAVRALRSWDAIAICDADFVPPLDALEAALEGASRDGKLHQPFTEALYLTEPETASWLSAGCLPNRSGGDLTGGCFVISPESWLEVGGMDERFEGWGGEDDAFRIAAETLLGPRVHHQGVMPHLWHPSAAAFGTEAHRGNLALLRRYVAAANNPEAIRAIINERS